MCTDVDGDDGKICDTEVLGAIDLLQPVNDRDDAGGRGGDIP